MITIRFSNRVKKYPIKVLCDPKRPTYFNAFMDSEFKDDEIVLEEYEDKMMNILYYLYTREDFSLDLSDLVYFTNNMHKIYELADYLLMVDVLQKIDLFELFYSIVKNKVDEKIILELPIGVNFMDDKDFDNTKLVPLFTDIIKLKYEDLGIKLYMENKIYFDSLDLRSDISYNLIINKCVELFNFICDNREDDSKILEIGKELYLELIDTSDILFENDLYLKFDYWDYLIVKYCARSDRDKVITKFLELNKDESLFIGNTQFFEMNNAIEVIIKVINKKYFELFKKIYDQNEFELNLPENMDRLLYHILSIGYRTYYDYICDKLTLQSKKELISTLSIEHYVDLYTKSESFRNSVVNGYSFIEKYADILIEIDNESDVLFVQLLDSKVPECKILKMKIPIGNIGNFTCVELFKTMIELKYEDLAIIYFQKNKENFLSCDARAGIGYKIFLNNCKKLFNVIKKYKSKILYLYEDQYINCCQKSELLYKWYDYPDFRINLFKYGKVEYQDRYINYFLNCYYEKYKKEKKEMKFIDPKLRGQYNPKDSELLEFKDIIFEKKEGKYYLRDYIKRFSERNVKQIVKFFVNTNMICTEDIIYNCFL
jgi:hypothetical protein